MGDGATLRPVGARNILTGPLIVVLVASAWTVAGLAAGTETLTDQQIAVGIAALGLVLVTVDALVRRGSELRWQTLFLRAVGIGILVLPVFVGVQAGEFPELNIPEGGPPGELELPSGEPSSFNRRLDQTLGFLLAIAALALVIWSGMLAALVRRTRLVLSRRRRTSQRLTAAGLPVGEHAAARTRVRGEALRRSARAMVATDDAREAVIAAYVALETHLISARFPREGSETAREFAARALVQDRPSDRERVEVLLQVFEAARFSYRRITDTDAQKARDLLAALVRD